MSVQLLLFVIAILLVAIFWELCKINSRIRRILPAPARITGVQQINDTTTVKADRI